MRDIWNCSQIGVTYKRYNALPLQLNPCTPLPMFPPYHSSLRFHSIQTDSIMCLFSMGSGEQKAVRPPSTHSPAHSRLSQAHLCSVPTWVREHTPPIVSQLSAWHAIPLGDTQITQSPRCHCQHLIVCYSAQHSQFGHVDMKNWNETG